MNLQNNKEIVWLSVDPFWKRVDFYPRFIAEKIEKTLQENIEDIKLNKKIQCQFDSDFYNATINLNNSGYFYQTTPGISFGRSGYKNPGFRSVRRLLVPLNKKITILCKFIGSELRIIDFDEKYDIKFEENIPEENIVNSNLNLNNNNNKILPWEPNNLDAESNNLEENVVIWQWCRGTVEKQGNLMKLNDDWWQPYLYEQNKIIENSFNNNLQCATIMLPIDSSQRIIEFINGTSFGIQKDVTNKKKRIIRRKIVTIQQLIHLIYNIDKAPIDVRLLSSIVSNDDEIPHEFFCSISQDIMVDPVKTIDGFTYDRISIETWFNKSDKSPLTGLNLENKLLKQNNDLKIKIEEFTRLKLNKKK